MIKPLLNRLTCFVHFLEYLLTLDDNVDEESEIFKKQKLSLSMLFSFCFCFFCCQFQSGFAFKKCVTQNAFTFLIVD